MIMQHFQLRCRSPGDSVLFLPSIHVPDAGVGSGARGPRPLVHCVRIPVSSFGIFNSFFLGPHANVDYERNTPKKPF